MSDIQPGLQEDLPKPPSGLLRLGSGCSRVIDADEEVFEVYANMAASDSEGREVERNTGLGFVSSKLDVMEIEIELKPPAPLSNGANAGEIKHIKRRKETKPSKLKEKTITASIHQDLGALRNRKGDTGSVVWRAGLLLAEFLLGQAYFPSPVQHPLLDPVQTKASNVLELGSGTGLLPVLLYDLFASWIATDQYDNLKLLSRNIKENKADKLVKVQEVDWLHNVDSYKAGRRDRNETDIAYDLVVAVDCIYNEALVKPFVATLERYAVPSKTLVWVVIELRSSDTVTVFLEEWLSRPGWEIWRLGDQAMGEKLAKGFVGWVGWRTEAK